MFGVMADALCAEAESEAQRLLDLLVLPPRDAVGRELQGYDHRRERQTVQFLLRRVQDGQERLQQAWNMERLRLKRIVEISTCERDSQQVVHYFYIAIFYNERNFFIKGPCMVGRLMQRDEDDKNSRWLQPRRSSKHETAAVKVSRNCPGTKENC